MFFFKEYFIAHHHSPHLVIITILNCDDHKDLLVCLKPILQGIDNDHSVKILDNPYDDHHTNLHFIIIYKDLLVCLEPLLRGLGHADPGSLVQALQVLMVNMTMIIEMKINMIAMIRSLRGVTRGSKG